MNVDKVFSVGGSVVRENLENLEKLAESFEQEEQTVVVTGAGDLSDHVEAVRYDSNNGEQDLVGIKATRLNAKTLGTAMGSYPTVPETLDELREAVSSGQDVVMGGLTPGYSTDAVAATVAEVLDSDLYIATTIDGVYDPHPENPDAERLEEVTVEKLMELVGDDHRPGSYELIDSTALNLIKRSEIPTKIFEGGLDNISDPEGAKGTEIVTE